MLLKIIVNNKLSVLIGILIVMPHRCEAEDSIELPTMTVIGRASDLLGVADSASQGMVGQPEFTYRPLARVGELVEIVPNALATQHSGSGKANQYFLRGFNLDHGTDFSVQVDGVPMNMPSHAHGQGYLDLNSVIPELVDTVDYGKGVYYAEQGDFSSAGYARLHTMNRLAKGLAKLTIGEFGYYRTVVADSYKIGQGNLVVAGEFNAYNGVWQQPEGLGKYNGLLHYSVDHKNWGYELDGKAYYANWTATNQIPQRAVDEGQLNLYGTMDHSDGGRSNRYSLASHLWQRDEHGKSDFNAYAVYSDLNLYSNFTGYLDNPLQGDQIQQTEHRAIIGGKAEHTFFAKWLGFDMSNTLGLQVRHDEVMGLALNHTAQRQYLSTVRKDDVSETSVGLYTTNQVQWLSKFRSIAGLRADFFDFDVNSHSLAANSGQKAAALLSPKLSLIFGSWANNELFINMGYGYHSNDARGTTLQIDPVTQQAATSVTPLVWSRGGEIGIRNQAITGLSSTLAVWWLQMNSELIFVGDAGGTEPTGRSERYGVEWNNYYALNRWLTLDADFALTTAYYTQQPSGANHIANSVGRVIGAGAVVKLPYHLFSTVRLRHFGDVPLNETGRFYARDTSLVQLGFGYDDKRLRVELDVFNLLDSKSNDIAYAYTSRLQGEPLSGVDGLLKHPVEPRMLRLTASLRF